MNLNTIWRKGKILKIHFQSKANILIPFISAGRTLSFSLKNHPSLPLNELFVQLYVLYLPLSILILFSHKKTDKLSLSVDPLVLF